MNIKSVVERTDAWPGRIFDLVSQILIVFSLVTFSIETLPGLSAGTRAFLKISETLVVSIFTVEYLLRLAVADYKIKYIVSFYGLIDLFAILPFYIASGVDLRAIRIFRLFRLLRLFKIMRFNAAIHRFTVAFVSIRTELVAFGVVALFLLYVSAVGIYYFEYPVQPDQFKSVFHCLWWSVVTLTTVGYGDMCPITVGGRLLASFVLFLGLGVIAVPTGLIASSLTTVMSAGPPREN